MPTALWLALGTFVSEDAASLTAAWLVGRGDLDALAAVAAVAAGIWLGDMGLWLAGRLLSRSERCHRWCVRRAPLVGGRALALAVDEPLAILTSRFVPGTRLPLYVTAGALGTRPLQFAAWTAAAVLVWTPLVVLGPSRWFLAGLAALALMRVLQSTWGRRHGRPVRLRLERWMQPEFWPTAVLYAPLVPWLAWLSVRWGGPGTLVAANPGFEDGGFVGESKFAILSALPPRWTIPGMLLAPGTHPERLAAFDDVLRSRAWGYPLILKPDVGEKGVGVRRVASRDDASRYLAAEAGAVIVQPFHPGPHEAGIFYYRRPGARRGHVFSITDKRFPFVLGDGVSTVRQLLDAHPRYRLQAALFLARHDGERVLGEDERLTLVTAGNHCQGAVFLDGAHLITSALEARIDEIACAVPGFYIGRFDVRYADPAAFCAGEELAIVELNGVTAESTNIYDPSFGAMRACRTLARQWQLAFEIGAANRARGVPAPGLLHVAGLVLAFWRRRPSMPIAS